MKFTTFAVGSLLVISSSAAVIPSAYRDHGIARLERRAGEEPDDGSLSRNSGHRNAIKKKPVPAPGSGSASGSGSGSASGSGSGPVPAPGSVPGDVVMTDKDWENRKRRNPNRNPGVLPPKSDVVYADIDHGNPPRDRKPRPSAPKGGNEVIYADINHGPNSNPKNGNKPIRMNSDSGSDFEDIRQVRKDIEDLKAKQNGPQPPGSSDRSNPPALPPRNNPGPSNSPTRPSDTPIPAPRKKPILQPPSDQSGTPALPPKMGKKPILQPPSDQSGPPSLPPKVGKKPIIAHFFAAKSREKTNPTTPIKSIRPTFFAAKSREKARPIRFIRFIKSTRSSKTIGSSRTTSSAKTSRVIRPDTSPKEAKSKITQEIEPKAAKQDRSETSKFEKVVITIKVSHQVLAVSIFYRSTNFAS
ncbi:hypothetical protein BDV3_001247 [Batrachochytrium dendrobatidis]